MKQHRWEQWLWTCVFALLPLLIWLLFARDTGATELLFYSLTACTFALSELQNADAAIRSRTGYESLCGASMLGIASSITLYAALLSGHVNAGSLSKILDFSIGSALEGFAVVTCAQIFVHARNPSISIRHTSSNTALSVGSDHSAA